MERRIQRRRSGRSQEGSRGRVQGNRREEVCGRCYWAHQQDSLHITVSGETGLQEHKYKVHHQ